MSNGNGRRSRRAITEEPQAHMDETLLEPDEDLASDLQEWEARNNSRKELARQAKEIKARIDEQLSELAEGAYRLGAFKISVAVSRAKSVSFETEGGKRSTKILKDKPAE